MFQLARRISFGMNIGDLFQLQRPFHGDRILIAAAEEQRMVLVGEAFRQRFDLFIHRQHLLDARRQRLQAVHDLLLHAFRHAFQAARRATSINSTVSCVVKALVEATPISVPALVIKARSDSRTSEEPATLQTASEPR